MFGTWPHTAHTQPGLTPLEREFDKLARDGADFPLFTGPSAGATVPHLDALEEVHKALGATGMHRPNAQLIELIRSGKFTVVGHAVPKQLPEGGGTLTEEVAGFTFNANGLAVVQTKAGTAPPIGSLATFCSALFSTILPALSDRPAAMVQWISLGRSALDMEAKHGWPAAVRYITQQLNDCVRRRVPFSVPSQAVLDTVRSSLGAPRAQQAGGSAPQQPGAAPAPFKQKVCEAWNFKREGCNNATCTEKHTCIYSVVAGAPCKAAFGSHKGAECPHKAAMQAARKQPGSGGSVKSRGGRGGGGGGSASVATVDPTPA
jgi:hypothetical protein